MISPTFFYSIVFNFSKLGQLAPTKTTTFILLIALVTAITAIQLEFSYDQYNRWYTKLSIGLGFAIAATLISGFWQFFLRPRMPLASYQNIAGIILILLTLGIFIDLIIWFTTIYQLYKRWRIRHPKTPKLAVVKPEANSDIQTPITPPSQQSHQEKSQPIIDQQQQAAIQAELAKKWQQHGDDHE